MLHELNRIRSKLWEVKPTSIKQIEKIVSKELPTEEWKHFDYKIDGQRWYGIITVKRNSRMGTIISMLGQKPVVIRGYPKIKYVEDVDALWDREVVLELKYDGTNIGIFPLGDRIMGKTRRVPRWDLGGFKGRIWHKLFEKTGLMENITRLVKNGFIVFGELYGSLNEGEYVKYPDVEIAYKVFDIVDLETLSFLPRYRVESLCSAYDIPIVEAITGYLSQETLEQYEQMAEQVYHDKKIGEGFVVKWYSDYDMDRYFGKLKAKVVKERSLFVSKNRLPTRIIREAIKKVVENITEELNTREIVNLVIQELEEDASSDFAKELIYKSRDKIYKEVIKYYERQYPSDICPQVFEYLEDLDIDITDKSKVMPLLAKKFKVNPKALFRCYQKYLKMIE